MTELDLGTDSQASSVQEACKAAEQVNSTGWICPAWKMFRDKDFLAPQRNDTEPDDWKHGWQYHACAALDQHYAASVHLSFFSSDEQALRLSQKGACASRHFTVLPTCYETSISSSQMRVLFLIRLHLPLQLDDRYCRCGEVLDARGFHRSACTKSGVLQARGTLMEVCTPRMCREAGASVWEVSSFEI